MASATGLLIILMGSLFVITLAAITINSMIIDDQIQRTNAKVDQIMSMLPEGKNVAFSDSQYTDAAKQMQSIHDSNKTGYLQFTDNCSGNVYPDNEYNWGCTSRKVIGEEEALMIIMHGLADQDRYHLKFDPMNTTKFDKVIITIVTSDGICHAWYNHMEKCYKVAPVAIKDIYYGVKNWDKLLLMTLHDGTKVYHYQPNYYVKTMTLNNGTIINGTLAQDVYDNYTKYGLKYFYILFDKDYPEFPNEHGDDLWTYEETDKGQKLSPTDLRGLQ